MNIQEELLIATLEGNEEKMRLLRQLSYIESNKSHYLPLKKAIRQSILDNLERLGVEDK